MALIPVRYPEKIERLIEEHQAGGVSAECCLSCCSTCCSRPGFAILENVVHIYDRYRSGGLQRADYTFEEGLSFRDFVFSHFDVVMESTGRWPSRREILVFHALSIDEQGRPIKVPSGGSYWRIRSELFWDNQWLSHGCVFLNRKYANWPTDDGDCGRHCLLHEPNSRTQLGTKPIDCVLHTCTPDREAKVPTRKLSREWFRALAESYPNSPERFEAMLAAEPQPKED